MTNIMLKTAEPITPLIPISSYMREERERMERITKISADYLGNEDAYHCCGELRCGRAGRHESGSCHVLCHVQRYRGIRELEVRLSANFPMITKQ